jgi:hypothetical protein
MLGNLQSLTTARVEADIPDALRTLFRDRCRQTDN